MASLVSRGPSYSEFAVKCRYNEDALGDGALSTNIELAVTDDSDQLENKYIETAGLVLYVPLDHYTTINKVVVQNRSTGTVFYDYFDDITTDNIIGEMTLINQVISFSAPDQVAGLFLFDLVGLSGVKVHLTIYGEY